MPKKKAKVAKKKVAVKKVKKKKTKAPSISKTAKKAQEREQRRKIREAEAELEFEPDEDGEVSAKLVEQEYTGKHFLETENPSRNKCTNCGKVMDEDLAIERRIGGKIVWFCRTKCADTYEDENIF